MHNLLRSLLLLLYMHCLLPLRAPPLLKVQLPWQLLVPLLFMRFPLIQGKLCLVMKSAALPDVWSCPQGKLVAASAHAKFQSSM